MSLKLNLTDRGPSIISGFDLFDECHFGADKLFLRGHFKTPEEVFNQIAIALGDEKKIDTSKAEELYGKNWKKELGFGNPLTITTSDNFDDVPNIALNRYKVPNKKFWENRVPENIANPYKAKGAVSFAIRVYLKEDSVFIKFGAPWSLVMDDEETQTEVVLDDSAAKELYKKFVPFSHCNISLEDTIQILSAIFKDVDIEANIIDSKTTVTTLDLEDEEGNSLF